MFRYQCTEREMLHNRKGCIYPACRKHLLNLFTSEKGIEKFGREKAEEIANHAKEVKAKGAKWCDCPACTTAMEVLKYKEDLLA